MNAFDRELQEKLKKPENLEDIAARLALHEKRTRIILIVLMVLAAVTFAVLLGHVLTDQ
jgi:hypothetical protein